MKTISNHYNKIQIELQVGNKFIEYYNLITTLTILILKSKKKILMNNLVTFAKHLTFSW
jgi:hypothetical protein